MSLVRAHLIIELHLAEGKVAPEITWRAVILVDSR
jgi:hypothetical protein